MVTAKRTKEKRKLQKGELYFLLTPGQVNMRTQRPKKGAIVHMGRQLVSSGKMVVACDRDLGRTYEIPFNAWIYELANVCRSCKQAVGEVEMSRKTFY